MRWFLIAAAVEYLRDDRTAYLDIDDVGIPSVKSNELLCHMIGKSVPFDPAAATQVAKQFLDQHVAQLNGEESKAVPSHEIKDVFSGRLTFDDSSVTVVVTNIGTRPQALFWRPSWCVIDGASGASSWISPYFEYKPRGVADFKIIKPGESLRFSAAELGMEGLQGDADTFAGGQVFFATGGSELGLWPWIGRIRLEIRSNR